MEKKLERLIPDDSENPGEELYHSLITGSPGEVRGRLCVFLEDLFSTTRMSPDSWSREQFYGGILTGTLAGYCRGELPRLWPEEGICVLSLQIPGWRCSTGVVIGLVCGPNDTLREKAEAALARIRDHEAVTRLKKDKCWEVHLYGIACRKASCVVRGMTV